MVGKGKRLAGFFSLIIIIFPQINFVFWLGKNQDCASLGVDEESFHKLVEHVDLAFHFRKAIGLYGIKI
jgi:hypothetical protein